MCLLAGYIEEACIIACPSDCKLSEWSNWSRCSKSCGSGVKVRSKWLREKPYNGGRPCPKLDHVNQARTILSAAQTLVTCGDIWERMQLKRMTEPSLCPSAGASFHLRLR